jgi:hypothetical protein
MRALSGSPPPPAARTHTPLPAPGPLPGFAMAKRKEILRVFCAKDILSRSMGFVKDNLNGEIDLFGFKKNLHELDERPPPVRPRNGKDTHIRVHL